MVDRSDWESGMGDKWAREWRQTDLSFSQLTPYLLTRITEHSFTSALDIGCGAGELALAVAEANPQAGVTGLDISASLIEAASERAPLQQAQPTFVKGDAAHWQPEDNFAPDLLFSRHGVMFFDDPPAAFGHLSEIAALYKPP